VFSTRNLTIMVLIAVLVFLVLIGLQYAEWRHYAAPAASLQP